MQKLIFHKGGSYQLNDFAEGDFVTLDFQLSFRIIKLHMIFLTFFVVLGIFRVWLDYVKVLL